MHTFDNGRAIPSKSLCGRGTRRGNGRGSERGSRPHENFPVYAWCTRKTSFPFLIYYYYYYYYYYY